MRTTCRGTSAWRLDRWETRSENPPVPAYIFPAWRANSSPCGSNEGNDRDPSSSQPDAGQQAAYPLRGAAGSRFGDTCLSSIILSPLNSNVKMSPYETGDIHVESEGTATRGCNFPLCEGGPGVCQSRRTARSIAATGATPQSALSARR